VALLPGEPAELLLGQFATPEKVAIINAQWGLDEPILIRYFVWLKNVLQGDFGKSILSQKPTLDLIKNSFPVSFQLCFMSMTFACLIGIPIGIFIAILKSKNLRHLLTFTTLIAQSIPSFVTGLIFIIIMSVKLNLLPSSGYVSFFENPLKNLQAMLMPSISLGLVIGAFLARFTRGCIMDSLQEDFVRTARSKGLKEYVILLKHALRPALIPIVSLIGTQIVWLLGGAIIQEMVFVLPGMGSLVVRAIMNRDYTVIQSVVLIIAITTALSNLLVDLLYGFLDPRIKYD